MYREEHNYVVALNRIYEKIIEDVSRILLERGHVIVYDEQHNVIDIIKQSDVVH